MSKVEINTNEFENALGSIETKVSEIKDIIKAIDKEMSLIDGSNSIWKGKAQDIVYTRYKEISGKYPEFETKLDDYVTFLKNTVELYKQENHAQSQSVVVQDDELDIV